jgi:hypothetical protein
VRQAAREQYDLAAAGPRPAQAVAQQGALRRPADEVGEPAARRLEPALCYGDALDRKGLDRLGEPLDRLPAEVAQPEQVADQAAGARGGHDSVGFGQGLQARSEIGRIADDIVLDDLAADDNQPGGDPNPRVELFGLIQPRHPFDQYQPASRCALGVVLMRLRISEINQNAIAHVAGNKAAKSLDNLCDAAMVGADDPAQILGIEPCRQGRRADEIAEHHRHLPPLGGVGRLRTGRCGGRRERLGGGQTRDGSEEALAVPERHAELLEIDVG